MFNYIKTKWVKGLLLFYVMTITNAALAQGIDVGAVEGTVSRGGAVLNNTQIVAMSLVLASYEATTSTDDQGYFNFIDVPLGTVEINVFDSSGTKIGSGGGTVVPEGITINLNIE